MPKLCRCGRIVADRCKHCQPQIKKKNTVLSGYGHDHRTASEQLRKKFPLCERCVMLYGVIDAMPSQEMHHIVSIASSENSRMNSGNWLAVCRLHHEELEGNVIEGMKTRRWSDENYSRLLME